MFIISLNTRAAKIHGRVKIREGPIIMCKHCCLACVCPTINLPSIRLKRQNARSLKETPLKSVVSSMHLTVFKLKYIYDLFLISQAEVYCECKQPVRITVKEVYGVLSVEIIILKRYYIMLITSRVATRRCV